MTLEVSKSINYRFSIGNLLEIEDKVNYYSGNNIILETNKGEIIFNFEDYTYLINGFCYSFDPENISFDLISIKIEDIISIKVPKDLKNIFEDSIEEEKISKVTSQRERVKTSLKDILPNYNN